MKDILSLKIPIKITPCYDIILRDALSRTGWYWANLEIISCCLTHHHEQPTNQHALYFSDFYLEKFQFSRLLNPVSENSMCFDKKRGTYAYTELILHILHSKYNPTVLCSLLFLGTTFHQQGWPIGAFNTLTPPPQHQRSIKCICNHKLL